MAAALRQSGERTELVAGRCWGGDARLNVLDAVPDGLAGWLEPEACPFGVVHDTLSARVAPRLYLAALKTALAGRAELRESWRCIGLDPAAGVARFGQGEISAGHVVLAAGTGAFPLLEALTGRPCGSGVKGQAALLSIAASGWLSSWARLAAISPRLLRRRA